MSKIFLLLAASMFFFNVNLDAQIFNKLSKVIDEAADDVTEKLSQQMVEKIIEKIFSGQSIEQDSTINSNSSSSSSSDSTSVSNSSIDLSSIFSSSQKIDKVFDFTHRMKMQMISSESTQEFNYFFNETDTYIGMDVSNMFVIMELETQKTYTIMNDRVITMSMKSLVEKMAPQGLENEYTITKTGKTETIAGFLCEEIIMENEENIINAWVTRDFINSNIEETAFIQEIKHANSTENYMGAFMRYTYTEKGKEDEEFTMNVIEFVPEIKTIDLKEY